jgi:restriction system protein
MTDYLPNPTVPNYPTYEGVRIFIKLMENKSSLLLNSMTEKIWAQRGTPQENKDWTNPENWIPAILDGAERDLALYISRESQGKLNPRHLHSIEAFIKRYELLKPDSSKRFSITEVGKDFVNHHNGQVVRELDYKEGLIHLLQLVAELGLGKRADFLPQYTQFLHQYSNYRADSTIASVWSDRMYNLRSRSLIERSGNAYQITKMGLDYLESGSNLLQQTGQSTPKNEQPDIYRLLKAQQDEVRQVIHKTLSQMNPYKVEQLVKTLLEAMGYENVEVTTRSGDGGVDVVADIEVGITLVREVVQVKRHSSNIGRPVLDQLRGSLYRFNAMRGTIITISDFSKQAKDAAFEERAAPITLIDGERFVELLIEHEIGVRKRNIQMLEFEASDFESDEPSA